MHSAYISPEVSRKSLPQRTVALMLMLTLALVTFGGAVFGAFALKKQEAQAGDPIQYIMCLFDEDALPRQMYQMTQTADLNFLLQSRSAVSPGRDDVEIGPAGLNWILGIFTDYKKVNETILGTSLDGDLDIEGLQKDDGKAPANYNGGPRVTPFDRFGVSGLTWSAYNGEWKYLEVDACATDGAEPNDPKAGMYYEERLEPRSTYEDVPKTKDVRTAQFAKGSAAHYGNAVVTLIANAIFFIAKLVVVLAIAFISFSFVDVTEVMGITDLLAGGPNSLFSTLYNGIFAPLIVLAFVITGIVVFWVGIVKKRFKGAIMELFKTIALFVTAILVAANPAFFVTLPNQIAIVAQSVIATTMGAGIAGGSGICTADGSQQKSVTITGAKEGEDAQKVLGEASANLRSVVGCQIWLTFLVNPWAQGQFGAGWNELWTKDSVPKWTTEAKYLPNGNTEEVGKASVPVGGGKTLDNWALYQISTQTNAHSPLGHEGDLSKYSGGVANDWWRIVDALSNYQETETVITGDLLENTGSATGTIAEVKIQEPDTSALPTQYWDTWVGNSPWTRVGIALTSVLTAGLGLAAPLLFAFTSAMYGVGLTLLMSVAPVMLLAGCFAGRGLKIFLSWAELILDTTMKRIVTGALMMLSIILVSIILGKMDDMGYWWSMIAMILVSVVLIKSRAKIMSMAAAVFTFRFSEGAFKGTTEMIANKAIGSTKTVGMGAARLATGTAAGALAAKNAGGSFTQGAGKGLAGEIKNLSYRSRMLNNTMASYESQRSVQGNNDLEGNEFCASCGLRLAYEVAQDGTGMFIGGRDGAGRLYCKDCFEGGEGPEGTVEYIAQQKERRQSLGKAEGSSLAEFEEQQRKKEVVMASKGDSFPKLQKLSSEGELSPAQLKALGTSDTRSVGAIVGELVARDQRSMAKAGAKLGGTPAIPQNLLPYMTVDNEMVQSLWSEGKLEVLLYLYTAAALEMFYDKHDDMKPGELTGTDPSHELNLMHAMAVEQYRTKLTPKQDDGDIHS